MRWFELLKRWHHLSREVSLIAVAGCFWLVQPSVAMTTISDARPIEQASEPKAPDPLGLMTHGKVQERPSEPAKHATLSASGSGEVTATVDEEAGLIDEVLKGEARHGKSSRELIPALNALADYFIDEEDYVKAAPVLQRVLSLSESETGESKATGLALRRVAVNLDHLRRFTDAEPLHLRSLKIIVSTFGEDTAELASGLIDFSVNCEARKERDLAEKHLLRAIAIREKRLTVDSTDTASAYMSLGLFYHRQEKSRLAEDYIRRALEIRLRIGPAIDAASSRSILGEVYQTQNRFRDAAVLHELALTVYERETGPDSDESMSVRSNLAEDYRSIGDYAKAAEMFKENLRLRRSTLQRDKYELLTAYSDLGTAYRDAGRYSQGAAAFEEGLKEAEAIAGHESTWAKPFTTQQLAMTVLLDGYAELLNDAERFGKAEAISTRALASAKFLADPEFGAGEPLLANALSHMADLYRATGRPRLALPLMQEVVAIRARNFEPNHHNMAAAYLNLAKLYESLGNYPEAERLFKQALAIYEGKETGTEASAIASLAMFYGETGRFSLGDPLMRKALALRSKVSGAHNYRTAVLMSNLGRMNDDVGNYDVAERLMRDGLRIATEELDANSLVLASMYNNLAINLDSRGSYDEAERLFERSNAIRLSSLGPASSQYAIGLYSLATFYSARGSDALAQPLYVRAQETFEQVFGEEHPLVALCLRARAAFDRTSGNYPEADRKLQRALSIYAKTVGSEHYSYYSTLGELANAKASEGDLERAERLFSQSLEGQRSRGESNPSVVQTMENLAVVLRRRGKLDDALVAARRTLEIRERALGSMNADTGDSHFQLALIHWTAGRQADAQEQFASAFVAYEASDRAIFAIGDERRKLDYARTLDRRVSALVSYALATQSSPAASAALEAVVRRKGRVLDAVSRRPARINEGSGQASYLQAWSAASDKYASLVFSSASSHDDLGRQERIKAAMETARVAEAAVYLNVPSMREQLESVSLQRIRAAIPATSALVEWFKYTPLNLRAVSSSSQYGPARYAAFTVRREGGIEVVDVGAALEIERELSDFAAAIRDPASRLVTSIATSLYGKLISPLRLPTLVENLIFSPDAQLNLLSFAALLDGDRKFLLERYGISYLTSGRDLLRPAATRPDWSRMVVIADPNFGTFRLGGPEAVISNVSFTALPGTAAEAKDIADVLRLGTSQVVEGSLASKAFVKNLEAPSLLHIATHAFFIPGVTPESNAESSPPDNPLVRAGLALAGANVTDQDGNQGILTALEVSSLDLGKTELVVLSACDAGTGDSSVGEGVFGLRRAFFIAGAKAQVVTLWKVADTFAPQLMKRMYQALTEGLRPADALRRSQLSMLDGPFKGPYYWANFVALGSVR